MENPFKLNKKIILAFGDSLTKGYYKSGRKYHPYSIRMNQLLIENNLDYEVVESGRNGETTTKMLERIKHFDFKKYAMVVIYAGENDLSYLNYDKIIENLIKLHDHVINLSLPTVHVTLPENENDKIFSFYKNKRQKVNEEIIKLIKDKKKGNIHLSELHKEIKYFSMTKEEKEEYFDDDVHMTPSGYDLMGEFIFKSIKNIL